MHSLHEAGVIWGDCKPQNVLIFEDQHDTTSIIAKLGDFGCAVFSSTNKAKFIGYSEPWTAPEARSSSGFDELIKAEIYSFGMLVWSIALNGQQFNIRYWAQEPLNDDLDSRDLVANGEVEKAKVDDRLSEIAIQSIRTHLQASRRRGPIASRDDIQSIVKIISETLTLDTSRRTMGLPAATGLLGQGYVIKW
jgi:serine/threonine protein kinase